MSNTLAPKGYWVCGCIKRDRSRGAFAICMQPPSRRRCGRCGAVSDPKAVQPSGLACDITGQVWWWACPHCHRSGKDCPSRERTRKALERHLQGTHGLQREDADA